MSAEPKDVRLPVMVTKTEAEAIDEWRYANRIPTRAEAIRRLITTGLITSPIIQEVIDYLEWSTEGDDEAGRLAALLKKSISG